jgi:hypothetical protein
VPAHLEEPAFCIIAYRGEHTPFGCGGWDNLTDENFYVHHVDCEIGKAHQHLRNGFNPGFTAAAARSFQPSFDNVAQAASFVEENGIPALTSCFV